MSLWLATLAANRPLGFLDHHLRQGNSLVGAWLDDLAQQPLDRSRTPRPLPLFDDDPVAPAMRENVALRAALEAPTESLEQVRAKERRLAEIERSGSPLSRLKALADLWCSRWFSPGGAAAEIYAPLSDAVLGRASAIPQATVDALLASVRTTARANGFFHWELEFPELFFEADGRRMAAPGFDAIVGNPPWEMLRNDSRLAGATAAGPDVGTMVRFSRSSGVYRAQSAGHANCYQMFLERTLDLLRPGGRLGLVLPSGAMTDQGSVALRRALFERCGVESVVGFENRAAIFPIHRSVRFVLISAQRGERTQGFRCRLGETDSAVLDHPSELRRRSLAMSVDLLRTLSGDGLSLPDLRSPADVLILERLSRKFAPLGSPEGWSARFGRELNATDDRRLLDSSHGPQRLPVLGGQHLEAFTAHVERSRLFVDRHDAELKLGTRHTRPRLAYRDVASPTNRTTLIAALLPAGTVSTHTIYCLRTPLGMRAQWYLCGLFNSLVVNYLVRLRVSSHVTTAIVERLPVPTAPQAGAAFVEIGALARLLSRRPDAPAWARLQARAALVLGLDEEEFAHVLATFPLIPRSERHEAWRTFRALS